MGLVLEVKMSGKVAQVLHALVGKALNCQEKHHYHLPWPRFCCS